MSVGAAHVCIEPDDFFFSWKSNLLCSSCANQLPIILNTKSIFETNERRRRKMLFFSCLLYVRWWWLVFAVNENEPVKASCWYKKKIRPMRPWALIETYKFYRSEINDKMQVPTCAYQLLCVSIYVVDILTLIFVQKEREGERGKKRKKNGSWKKIAFSQSLKKKIANKVYYDQTPKIDSGYFIGTLKIYGRTNMPFSLKTKIWACVCTFLGFSFRLGAFSLPLSLSRSVFVIPSAAVHIDVPFCRPLFMVMHYIYNTKFSMCVYVYLQTYEMSKVTLAHILISSATLLLLVVVLLLIS